MGILKIKKRLALLIILLLVCLSGYSKSMEGTMIKMVISQKS
ncbi:MAG: hypothetical protein ACK5KQ_00725 [Anaerorhabdus sp.]